MIRYRGENLSRWRCPTKRFREAFSRHRGSLRAALTVVGFLTLAPDVAIAQSENRRPVTLDDILGETRIDRVQPSPTGELVAVITQRPASDGEVYGRTYYETDPSRNDLVLFDGVSGAEIFRTKGKEKAAGFWCPVWSPDGQRLALLSTMPEGAEPIGGDNVRIYLWDKHDRKLSRLTDRGVLSQPRFGSGMYQLDVRGPLSGGSPIACNGNENASFAWLDNSRIVLLATAQGVVSGLISEHGHPMQHVVETAAALTEGRATTATAVNSGLPSPLSDAGSSALLEVIDVKTRVAKDLGVLPVFPFRGRLSLSIAPGSGLIAVMPTVGAVPGASIPFAVQGQEENWTVERRFGIADPEQAQSLSWVTLPLAARYPLQLLDWNAAGTQIALRARANLMDKRSGLFVLRGHSIIPVGGKGLVFPPDLPPSSEPAFPPAFWLDNDRLLARLETAPAQEGDRAAWWIANAAKPRLSKPISNSETVTNLYRIRGQKLWGTDSGDIIELDRRSSSFIMKNASACERSSWTAGDLYDVNRETTISIGAPSLYGRPVTLVDRASGKLTCAAEIPASSKVEAIDVTGRMYYSVFGKFGLTLYGRDSQMPNPRPLIEFNEVFKKIDWGNVQFISAGIEDNTDFKIGVILPPGYKPSKRYPMMVWVYPGNIISGVDDYSLAIERPGFYNLYLYAALGYAVVVPTMPLRDHATRDQINKDISSVVNSAIVRVVDAGFGDPDRVAILGQSFGGYAAYVLAASGKQYGAVAALSGISDPQLFSREFDVAARGYRGIEHLKSMNWLIAPQFGSGAAGGGNYIFDSASKIASPLLMAHGEYDSRGGLIQAQALFSELSLRQKPARLVTYWGENHAIALSPANVKNVFGEVVSWFDKFVMNDRAPTSGR